MAASYCQVSERSWATACSPFALPQLMLLDRRGDDCVCVSPKCLRASPLSVIYSADSSGFVPRLFKSQRSAPTNPQRIAFVGSWLVGRYVAGDFRPPRCCAFPLQGRSAPEVGVRSTSRTPKKTDVHGRLIFPRQAAAHLGLFSSRRCCGKRPVVSFHRIPRE